MYTPSNDGVRARSQSWLRVGLAFCLVGIGLALASRGAWAGAGTGAIWGRVTYDGGIPGDHPLLVCLSGGTPDPHCLTPNDGAYVFDGVAAGDYTVKALVNVYTDDVLHWGDTLEAWYDADGDGQPDTITVAGGSVSGIDISVGGPWIPLNGPAVDGGRVWALGVDAGDPDVVYASVAPPYSASNGKVFKSTDAGATWTAVYTPTAPVYDLAARGDKVCLAGARDQVSVLTCSDDAGATWSELDDIAPGYLVQAFDITISSEVSSTLLLAGRVVTITDGSDIEDIDQTYGLPAVLRSTNGGGPWERVLERPNNEGERTAFYAIAQDPSTPDRFFVGGDDAWLEIFSSPAGTIYRVEDANWAEATRVYTAEVPSPILALAIDPNDGDAILASTLFSVLRSADGGDTWVEALDKGGESLAFASTGDAHAMTPNDRVVYTSDDGGVIWDSGVALDGCCGKLAAGTNLYAGGCSDGVLRSTDGGANWAPGSEGITSLVSPRSLAVDPFDPNHMFAAADRAGGWRSADGGAAWSQDRSERTGVYAFHPRKEGVVYRGVSSTVQGSLERSAGGGKHWEVVYTSTMDYGDDSLAEGAILAIASATSRPSTIYAGGYDKPRAGDALARHAIIVRSAQDGVAGSWVERHRLAAGSWVEALAVHPTDPDVAYAGGTWNLLSVDNRGFAKRTTDGGATWITVFTDTHAVKTIAIDAGDPLVVYVGTEAERIFRSEDGGDTWTAVRLAPEEGGVPSGDLVVADPRAAGRVYLAGWGTVLESTDRGDTWLDQPSPFDPVPEQAPNSLTVVNHSGRQTFYFGAEGLWSFTRLAPRVESSLFLPAIANARP